MPDAPATQSQPPPAEKAHAARRRIATAVRVSAVAAVIGGIVWFVYAPLADVVCSSARGRLDQPTATTMRACERACKHGSARACVLYGDLRYAVLLGLKDDPRADEAERVQRDCDRSNTKACMRLGELYTADGPFDPTPNWGRARAAWARACDGGLAEACGRLAKLDYISSDYARAVPLLVRACSGDDGFGCALLGDAYESGHGVPLDAKHGEELRDRGCDLGWYPACASMSKVHRARGGDWHRAADRAARACFLGDDDLCPVVAADFASVMAPPLDASVIDALDARCAVAASAAAGVCDAIATIYGNDLGPRPDPPRAVLIAHRGCAAGSIKQCIVEARVVAMRDPVEGDRLLDHACAVTDAVAPECAIREFVKSVPGDAGAGALRGSMFTR
jgi:hypothetical protein